MTQEAFHRHPHPNPQPTREITSVHPVDEELAEAYRAIGSQVVGMQVEVHDIADPEQRVQALHRLAQYRHTHPDTASKYDDLQMLEMMDDKAKAGEKQLLVYTSAIPTIAKEFHRRLTPAKAAAMARITGRPQPELVQRLNAARKNKADRDRA